MRSLRQKNGQDAAPTAALVTVAPGVNLNGFYDILHNGEMCEDKTFSISLALDLPTETVVQLGADAKPEKVQVPDRLSVSFGLGEKTRDIEVAKARFSLGSAKVLEVERGNGWFSDVLQDTDAVTFAFRNFIPMLVLSDKGRSTGPSQDLMNVLAKSSFHVFLWNHWIASLVHSIGPLRKRVPWSASVGARARPSSEKAERT